MHVFLLHSIILMTACAPGTAVTKIEVSDDTTSSDTALTDDSGQVEASSEPSGEPSVEIDPNADIDGDGFTPNEGDCDDDNPTINPDMAEIENGMDDNCNGSIDEGTDAFDDDGDGYSENEGDCDDTRANINPAALEILDDGIDQDCSGTDLSCDSVTTIEWTATFPQTSGCDWGNNGNLAATQGIVTARTEQVAIYVPENGAAICAVRPSIQANQGGHAQSFIYNDDVMLVYNDYVLFSTNDNLVDSLQTGSAQGKLYDWSRMPGVNYTGFMWRWGTSIASFGVGQMFVAIQNNKMSVVNDLSIINNAVDFMLVSFGDDDNAGSSDGADCSHSGLSFPVEIDLAN